MHTYKQIENSNDTAAVSQPHPPAAQKVVNAHRLQRDTTKRHLIHGRRGVQHKQTKGIDSGVVKLI